MSDTILKVSNLSKRYRIGAAEKGGKTFREAVMEGFTAPVRNFARLRNLTRFKNGDEEDTIWALKDISFEVKEGEVLGVIGRNGAGKSTLLKILSRIVEPTSGFVEIHGRISSLLEVGTGFHPELTGRENIFLNGGILGMRKKEIESKFDDIVSFSEIGKFIDTPVKRYSSGMYVRLAFAVAAHLEPEILLVDEVLAVGDISFQKKCLGKMTELAGGGRTILFVSHNMTAIQLLCEKCMLLENGRIEDIGRTSGIVDKYLNVGLDISNIPLAERKEQENSDFVITDIEFLDSKGQKLTNLSPGQPVSIVLSYICEDVEKLKMVDVLLRISQNGQQLFELSTYNFEPFRDIPPKGRFICNINRLPLVPGHYSLGIGPYFWGQYLYWMEDAIKFYVKEAPFFPTAHPPGEPSVKFFVDHSWETKSEWQNSSGLIKNRERGNA